MNQNNNRWKQRFSEFQKALKSLEKALMVKDPDEIYRAGIIQYFEMTFELAWKSLKDYLFEQGFDPKTPRQTIQQAFRSEIIEDGHVWIDALEMRNMIAHTYDENHAKDVEKLIRNNYFSFLKALEAYFLKKL